MAGPHMMVSGFVLADIAIQQPLTDFVWLANPGSRYQVRKVAQIFHAMKLSLHSLRRYRGPTPAGSRPHSGHPVIAPHL
jgi:hypothetical protein